MSTQRKAGPALYELIGRQTRVTSGTQIGGRGRPEDDDDHRHRSGSSHEAKPAHTPLHLTHPAPQPALRPEPVAAADPDALPPAALGPGRAVRLPSGYLLFGLAAVLAAAIGGYMFGWVQKEREQTAAERLEAQRTPAGTLAEPRDEAPIVRPKPAGNTTPPRQNAGNTASTTQQPPPKAVPGVTVIGRGVADPREAGLNYALVASLGQDRAMEAAEFLATNGVAVIVLPRDNRGFYPVVSLTGFSRDQFRAGAHRDHERRLRDLGAQFAKLGGGRKDFSDLLWSKYSG